MKGIFKMGHVDVSIILINFFTFDLLTECIKSIQTMSDGFSYEIIIVDNSCDKNEKDMLNKKYLNKDFVKIIYADDNLGTSKANNLGASVALGDYLMFLNCDTILKNNAIYFMLCTAKNKRAKVIGSNLYTNDLKPTHSFIKNKYTVNEYKKINSIFYTFKRKITQRRDDFNYSGSDLEINGYICSAALIVDREVFNSCGMFDEDIFMYGDDPLLCYKLRYIFNEKMYICTLSKIIHLEGGSDFKIFSVKKAHNYVYGPYIYFLKAFGDRAAKQYLKIAKRIYFTKALFTIFTREKYKNFINLYNVCKEMLKSDNHYIAKFKNCN